MYDSLLWHSKEEIFIYFFKKKHTSPYAGGKLGEGGGEGGERNGRPIVRRAELLAVGEACKAVFDLPDRKSLRALGSRTTGSYCLPPQCPTAGPRKVFAGTLQREGVFVVPKRLHKLKRKWK